MLYFRNIHLTWFSRQMFFFLLWEYVFGVPQPINFCKLVHECSREYQNILLSFHISKLHLLYFNIIATQCL